MQLDVGPAERCARRASEDGFGCLIKCGLVRVWHGWSLACKQKKVRCRHDTTLQHKDETFSRFGIRNRAVLMRRLLADQVAERLWGCGFAPKLWKLWKLWQGGEEAGEHGNKGVSRSGGKHATCLLDGGAMCCRSREDRDTSYIRTDYGDGDALGLRCKC